MNASHRKIKAIAYCLLGRCECSSIRIRQKLLAKDFTAMAVAAVFIKNIFNLGDIEAHAKTTI